ncbi:MAG: hypothetical protein A2007_04745 [Verrucomicrobia bacterium GWC2_42_7]|nr:MAG: hypothetical protein A2007_04745 [Verrucomicrobia bacterium GWC2_42_7]
MRKPFFLREKKKRIKIRAFQRKAIIAQEKSSDFSWARDICFVITLMSYAIPQGGMGKIPWETHLGDQNGFPLTPT